jgi:tRNA (adenine57-N1/adenine58-N1)-methyltransferase
MNFGDLVLLQDRRGRRYMFRLKEGGSFDTQRGSIRHQQLLGLSPGDGVATAQGEGFTLQRPTLEDYVLEMPREATPTYPKDAATMAFLLDLAPGMKVLEAGSGSGGLTLYLARAVGPGGQVWSLERSERHLHKAQHNQSQFEDWSNITWQLGKVEEAALPSDYFDGIALDLMEPWLALNNLAPALKPGRSLVAYLPNITQVVTLLEQIQSEQLPYQHGRTLEVIHREWDIRPPVAHPRFQQVGHTAFLVELRRTERGKRKEEGGK